ncbi:MAG: hypothetical protein IKW77_09315 [Salinivirgaceae bacterium]|nr:hypothetical protein [Salinivirgaceae bacterium]
MKKFLCILFACSLVAVAMADYDDADYSVNWTYGNIYAKEPNQSIALEKEYMYVSGDRVETVFCFRNTTDSTVVVPCAFPILATLPFTIKDDTVIIGNRLHDVIDTNLWNLVLDGDYFNYYENRDDFVLRSNLTESDIKKLDKKLRVMTFPDYQKQYGQEYEERIGKRYLASCNIMQDGNVVELKNVGIETTVEINEKDEHGPNKLELVLHFYHELKFLPNAQSKVIVNYNANSCHGYDHYSDNDYSDNDYLMYYDISNGSTWKNGIIGSFIMMTDFDLTDAEEVSITQLIPYNICSARNYKPIGRFKFIGQSWKFLYERRGYSPGDETAFSENKHISLKKNGSKGYIKTLETYKGDLNSLNPFLIENEVSFKIDEPCVGPFVANGFIDNLISEKNRCLYRGDDFEKRAWSEDPEFQKDSLWKNYSRIKTAILTNDKEGWSDTLQLKDRFPAYPYDSKSYFNDGWFGANAVQNVRVLRPGEYKFAVNDIYKGDSTESVGVSHIWFYPVDATLVSIIDEDKNSTMPLFSDVWKRVLDIHISDEKNNFENDDNEGDSDVVEIKEQKQELPIEQQEVKVDADKSNSTVVIVLIAVGLLSILAAAVIVRKKKKK